MFRYTHADGRTGFGDSTYQAICNAIGREEANLFGWPELWFTREPGDTCLQKAALIVEGVQLGEYMEFHAGEVVA